MVCLGSRSEPLMNPEKKQSDAIANFLYQACRSKGLDFYKYSTLSLPNSVDFLKTTFNRNTFKKVVL